MNAQTQTPSQQDRATRRAHRRLIQMRLDAAGLSQSELASSLGITAPAVNKTITGNGTPSPRVLDALRELGVPSEYLFAPRHKAGKGEAA